MTEGGMPAPMVTLSGEMPGADGAAVVWLADEADYAEHGRDAYAIPWPVHALRIVGGPGES